MGLLSNALDALFKKRTNAASLSGAMVPIVTNVGTAGNPQYAIAGIDSMANIASVLGAVKSFVTPSPNGGVTTIPLGSAKTVVMLAWVNSGLAASPALLLIGRNGAINKAAGDGNFVVTDTSGSFCVFKANNTDSFITVKNNMQYNLNLYYYLIYIE